LVDQTNKSNPPFARQDAQAPTVPVLKVSTGTTTSSVSVETPGGNVINPMSDRSVSIGRGQTQPATEASPRQRAVDPSLVTPPRHGV
jgi:hypothetical protein